jgi:hypothetical protein
MDIWSRYDHGPLLIYLILQASEVSQHSEAKSSRVVSIGVCLPFVMSRKPSTFPFSMQNGQRKKSFYWLIRWRRLVLETGSRLQNALVQKTSMKWMRIIGRCMWIQRLGPYRYSILVNVIDSSFIEILTNALKCVLALVVGCVVQSEYDIGVWQEYITTICSARSKSASTEAY